MKILHLFLTSLFLFTPVVFAQSVEGKFNCKITGSTVESTEEGRYKSYSGVKGWAKVGDEAVLIYSVTENTVSLSMELDAKKERKSIISDTAYAYVPGPQSKARRTKDSGIILSYSEHGFSLSLLPDYLRLKEFSELVLTRYYKNDWHGVFVNFEISEMSVVILTFNCRHINDQFERAFKIFK